MQLTASHEGFLWLAGLSGIIALGCLRNAYCANTTKDLVSSAISGVVLVFSIFGSIVTR